MSNKVIVLSGRQGSGKTEFASLAVNKYGFTKIAIADRLKEVVSELYNIPLITLIDPILKQKSLDIPWVWNKDSAHKLEKITGLNLNLDIEERVFYKPREALQYIGTDVIRLVDQDFHIKECIKKIKYHNNKNIIVDDQRFPSERTALSRFNPVEYFLVRPYNFEYSNHTSEISLNRSMFDNIIWNRKTLQYLTNTIKLIMETHTYTKKRERKDKSYWLDLMSKYGNITNICHALNISNDSVVNHLRRFCIFYDNNLYNYDKDAFLLPSKLNSYVCGYLAGDGCVSKLPRQFNYGLYLNSIDLESILNLQMAINSNKPYVTKKTHDNNKNIYRLEICSPSIIEDLKLWNIIPRTKEQPKNKLPDIIIDNKEYMKYWTSGIIDADGSISIDKNKRLSLDILASHDIIVYIKNYLDIDNYTEYPLKKSKQLVFLKYRGKYALEGSYKLHNEYCLPRKWDKIKDLI